MISTNPRDGQFKRRIVDVKSSAQAGAAVKRAKSKTKCFIVLGSTVIKLAGHHTDFINIVNLFWRNKNREMKFRGVKQNIPHIIYGQNGNINSGK
ncbi:hypothetical protein [Kluyvera ascorbata]|uniref:hypothetical protein n=1 Tax=Kluyvera ascorbata TaxID=51288 RepID=UPI0039F6BE70